MTLEQTVETPPHVLYIQLVGGLNPHELSMLRAIEQDAATAIRSKPATGLSIFQKTQPVFYVLPPNTSELDKLIKRERVMRSGLVLEPSCNITLDLLNKLIKIANIIGKKPIVDVKRHLAQAGREIDCEYFEYRVEV